MIFTNISSLYESGEAVSRHFIWKGCVLNGPEREGLTGLPSIYTFNGSPMPHKVQTNLAYEALDGLALPASLGSLCLAL